MLAFYNNKHDVDIVFLPVHWEYSHVFFCPPEQYDAFVKFSYDQVQRRFDGSAPTCKSDPTFMLCGNVHSKGEMLNCFNPFTPESDQCQTSPAASPVILHHIVWGTWLFIAYADERWLYHKILTASPIHFSLGRLGECTFWAWDWKG